MKIGPLLIVRIYLKINSWKLETPGVSPKGALVFFVKNGPLYEKHPCNVNLWFTRLKHHSLESELYKLSFGVFKFHIRLVVLTQSFVLCIFLLMVHTPLRLYKSFKSNHVLKPYLSCIKIDRHRHALSKFRCSSHFLEVERARHQNCIPPFWERTCPFCPYAVDDELHLLLFCSRNRELRGQFLNILFDNQPDIAEMHHSDKFVSIMSSTNHILLQALGKYIFESFKIRNIWFNELHFKYL